MTDRTAKPLDLLKRVVAQALKEGGEVPSKIIEDLVSDHLDFVDLIIRSMSYDEACKVWNSRLMRQ